MGGAPLKKSTSEHIKTATYTVAEDGTHEVTATSPTAELREADEYASLFGTAFGQAWYWLKERKRASSVALNAYVTYVTLPWHWIVAGWLASHFHALSIRKYMSNSVHSIIIIPRNEGSKRNK